MKKIWKVTYDMVFNSPIYIIAGTFEEAVEQAQKNREKNWGPVRSIEWELDTF